MLIAGAGRHTKDLLLVISEQKTNKEIVFFDDVTAELSEHIFSKYRILRSIEEAQEFLKTDNSFVLGLGGTNQREIISNKLNDIGGVLTSIISRNSIIGNFDINLADGLNIMPNSFISNSVSIGKGTLINTSAKIHHDVKIGKFCDIAPGATILGGVYINDFSFIGANATILPNVKVGMNCKIGAGSVVTKSIPSNSTAVGVPAKVIKVNNE
ncbi:acetyltransferase [Rhodohalobacter sp. 8-1]|uniref:acetyltransferase n=1 Tax=Rhodohalobacter sp. 8-1 TaxID=3131972 RepID=UPI0030ED98B0